MLDETYDALTEVSEWLLQQMKIQTKWRHP